MRSFVFAANRTTCRSAWERDVGHAAYSTVHLIDGISFVQVNVNETDFDDDVRI